MTDHSTMQNYTQAGDWLLGTARRNPEALLLLAAGCCLLMRSRSSSRDGGRARISEYHPDRDNYQAGSPYQQQQYMGSQSAPRKVVSQAGEAVSRATDAAGEYVTNVKQRVTEAAGSYADTVSRYTQDAGRSIYEQSERFTRQAQSTVQETISRVVREQPLAVAAVGLAAGAAVAAIFPSTRIENRTFGGAREALTEAASKAGENLMGAATQAGERLVSAAAQRGLSSEGLKNMAGEVAETFSNSITGNTSPASPSIAPQKPGIGSDVGKSSIGGSSMARAGNETGGRSKP
jgi:hypothetical protein